MKYLTLGDSKIYHVSRYNNGKPPTLCGMLLIDEYHPEDNPEGYKYHSSRQAHMALCKRCKISADKRGIKYRRSDEDRREKD
jgi:hypothetical protein